MNIPDQRDRRRAPRWQVTIAGSVRLSGARLCDCSVRDLSSTGARLAVPRGQWVPDEFVLRILNLDDDFEAAVRWRDGDSIGIEFLGGLSAGRLVLQLSDSN